MHDDRLLLSCKIYDATQALCTVVEILLLYICMGLYSVAVDASRKFPNAVIHPIHSIETVQQYVQYTRT
jgi:hypothetical protein